MRSYAIAVLVLALAGCEGSSDILTLNEDYLRACADDGNPCTQDLKVRGKCVHPPVAAGTVCGGGSVCVGTSCVADARLPEVGVGETQVCASYPSGEVYCWGTNCEGGLGIGQPADCSTIHPPAPVVNLSNAIDLATGDEHSCVVKADATAACWGWYADGSNDPTSPVTIGGLGPVAKVGAGRTHSCAVLQSGEVACWGDNFFGQLGNPGDGSTPRVVPGISDAVAIALGHDHACAVHATDGSVSCWGNNSDGQLGNGGYGCNGASDCPAPGTLVAGLTGVTQVAASYVHTCAVQGTGQVYCFGWLPFLDASGNLDRADVLSPRAVEGLADAVQVSTSEIMDDVDCAVRRNGQIVCWGQNSLGQFGSATAPSSVVPVPVSGLP